MRGVTKHKAGVHMTSYNVYFTTHIQVLALITDTPFAGQLI